MVDGVDRANQLTLDIQTTTKIMILLNPEVEEEVQEEVLVEEQAVETMLVSLADRPAICQENAPTKISSSRNHSEEVAKDPEEKKEEAMEEDQPGNKTLIDLTINMIGGIQVADLWK